MIDISLHFGADELVDNLTFVLAKRDNSKIGLLSNPQDVTASISCEEAPGISVKFYKTDDNPYWDDINMFKLIYVPELDTYFSIECETSEGNDGIYKALTLTRLAESELEQIKVYGLQINTEEEIILPDYDSNFPNVLYRDPIDIHAYDDIWNSDEKYEDYTDAQKSDVLCHSSILHRVLSFAPHYSIGEVDESIQNIQRIFQFDNTSVYECLKNIAEEISIIFDFTGRTVNAYDALSSCNTCGYRGYYTGTCPNCGGSDITEGFGENTGICIGKDTLGNDITYQRNEDALCNCYHVVGGDDTMTAAIRNCNPNGGYVWSFSDETKNEMSTGLKTALDTYDALYEDYQTTHVFDVSSLPLSDYNILVAKYRALDSDVKVDPISSITGYSELIKAYYDAIDFGEYLNNGLYPSITNNGKSAAQVVAGLTDLTLSPVSIMTTDGLTLASASSAVISYARILSDPLFDIKAVSSELLNVNDVWTWTGVLSATNYYDKDDTAKTGTLRIVINSDIENFAQNSVKQTLLNRSKGNAEIINMYVMTDEELANALKYYSYQALTSINDCYVKSVETLTSIGADDAESDAHEIYLTTKDKLDIISAELSVREDEVQLVDFKDSTTSMVALLKGMIDSTKAIMKIENNLTSAQWIELNSFRRESDYSNDNYVSTSFRKKFDYVDSQFISDSLTNAELIKRAYEFLMQAEYKIRENNKYSYQINTSLQNLLAISEFAGLRSSFKCGNWLRVMDNQGQLYKLRLIKYEVDFNDLSTISVEFADVSLNSSSMNQMQKWMSKTWQVVDKFDKSENQGKSNLVTQNGDITNDYNYSDAYTSGESYQNIEIMNNQVTTKFNVIDGLIQGKISAEQALSLIAQELNKITLTVANGDKASTITIKYDNVDISTSGNITLGGTVIFSDDLTNGTTVISGDNILTGTIMSANYEFTTGQIFSDTGSMFDLLHGDIRTPGLFTSGKNGDLHIAGYVYASGGRIGDFELTDLNADNFALEHSHNAWKLRSAPIAGQNGKRYYVSLTKQRNLVVSDSRDDAHSADNDMTPQCNIGAKSYPWRYGYFNRLYMDGCLLGIEYFRVTLDAAEWDSTYHTITVEAAGITNDTSNDQRNKQYISIGPAYNDSHTELSANAWAFHDSRIELVGKYKNHLVFMYLGNEPQDDIDVYVYAQYARPIQSLDDPYNASITWYADEQVCKVSWYDPNDEMFVTWDSSILVRKFGSEPVDATDGDVLATYGFDTGTGGESEKDKYSVNPYIDDEVATLTPGKYYYKIFAKGSDDSVSSYCDSIYTSDAPVIIDVSETICNYELSVGFYEYVTLVYKQNSEPSSISDGIVIDTLTNLTVEEKAQYVSYYNGLEAGNYYFKIFASLDGTEVESNAEQLFVISTFDFDYTGQIQEFVVPATGRYKLETWGAQGAGNGGYGGYSVGEVTLTQGDTLYITVGGQNGFNGGGGTTIAQPIIKDLTVVSGVNVAVNYKVYPGVTYPYTNVVLAAKKDVAPQSINDADKTLILSEGDGSETMTNLDELSQYYFVIFVEDELGNTAYSDAVECLTGEQDKIFNEMLVIAKSGTDMISFDDNIEIVKIT